MFSGNYYRVEAVGSSLQKPQKVINRGNTNINKGLEVIKKKLPKFRVKKKLRNINFHRIIKTKATKFYRCESLSMQIKRKIKILKQVKYKKFLYRQYEVMGRRTRGRKTQYLYLHSVKNVNGGEAPKPGVYSRAPSEEQVPKVGELHRCNIRVLCRLITRKRWSKFKKINKISTVPNKTKPAQQILKALKLPKPITKQRKNNTN